MPTVERVARTDSGLASELRISVMRLRRRLVAERHPDNELSMSQMAVLGQLYRNGDRSVGDLATAEGVQPPSMTIRIRAPLTISSNMTAALVAFDSALSRLG